MDEDLVLGVLRRAIQERQPAPGLIHHTDRGGQFAWKRYREVLRRSGMRQSMSAAENCYDNAFMESCFGTVKTELELVEYGAAAEAVREISSTSGTTTPNVVIRRWDTSPGRVREPTGPPK